jgi:sodium-dependent dicarboxylate transporter 2/3/5
MIPIVVAMLRFMGIEDLWNSKLGTSLVLAVAWGSSLGGFLTPLGGAPNLLAMKFVQDMVTHHEFLFTTWVTRLAPLTIGVVAAAALYMATVFTSEAPITIARVYFFQEARPGPMTGAERIALAFSSSRPFSRSRAASRRLLPAFTPAYALLTLGLVAFAVRARSEPLVTWEFAQSKMMWGLFCVFAGGNALGAVLNTTGAAQFLASPIVPYAARGPLVATIVFGALTMVVAQITATSRRSPMVPICVRVFQEAGVNPIPYTADRRQPLRILLLSSAEVRRWPPATVSTCGRCRIRRRLRLPHRDRAFQRVVHPVLLAAAA